VSVAEVGEQDLWQKAVLGIACVANDKTYVNQVLDQALNLIGRERAMEVVRSQIEWL
jgi:uncharacterized protein YlxP (DUF503 family)